MEALKYKIWLISKYYIKSSPQFSEKSIIIWCSIAVIVGIVGTIGDLIESKFNLDWF